MHKYFQVGWMVAVAWLLCGCGPASFFRHQSHYRASDFTNEGQFTGGIEGPVWHPDGQVYLVNFVREGTIGRIGPDGKASLLLDLPEGSVGNGIRVHADGDLMVADYKGHNLLKVNIRQKTIAVFAHEPAMHQPNDLAYHPSGYYFASDPDWKNGKGQIWRIGQDGSATCLERDMGTTNGIEVNPQGNVLYVGESLQRRIWRYDVDEQGRISGKRLFHTFPDHGMDGMRCDFLGNLYVTRHGKGTVVCLDANGHMLTEIQLKGKKPSNITFAGKDGCNAVVTLQDRGMTETFRVPHAGQDWKRFQKH